MAFKSLQSYNEERYGNFFRLVDDGDSADVIFLYRNFGEVGVFDCHYIKSADYSGYVQCLGGGCPACGKGIKVASKIFIPLYNLSAQKVEFWDRTAKFGTTLQKQVFEVYDNPSEYVFKIIRHGERNSMETTYEIRPIAKNTVMSYDEIMKTNNFKFPEFYDIICKDYTAIELNKLLTHRDTTNIAESYGAVARPSFDDIADDGLPVSANYSVSMEEPKSATKFSKFSNDSEEEEADEDVSFN